MKAIVCDRCLITCIVSEGGYECSIDSTINLPTNHKCSFPNELDEWGGEWLFKLNFCNNCASDLQEFFKKWMKQCGGKNDQH